MDEENGKRTIQTEKRLQEIAHDQEKKKKLQLSYDKEMNRVKVEVEEMIAADQMETRELQEIC